MYFFSTEMFMEGSEHTLHYVYVYQVIIILSVCVL